MDRKIKSARTDKDVTVYEAIKKIRESVKEGKKFSELKLSHIDKKGKELAA